MRGQTKIQFSDPASAAAKEVEAGPLWEVALDAPLSNW